MKSYLRLMFVMIVFGSVGLFVKWIPLSSGEIALWRTILGSIVLFLLLLTQKNKYNWRVFKQNALLLLVSGVCMGLNWIFLFEAYRFSSVGIATLAYYCAPVLVIIVSPFLLKEKLTLSKIFGIFCVMIGMLCVNGVAVNGVNPTIGLSFGLAAACMYACVMVINKFFKNISAMETTFYQLIAAITILLPYVLLSEETTWTIPSGWGLASLLVLGIFHTGICYALFFSSFKHLKGQTVALFSYIDPVSALCLSFLFLGETLSFFQILGAVLILFGAAFGETAGFRKRS